MSTTITENQKRTKQPTRVLNSDQRFVKQVWARIFAGERVRVWLHGFNYQVRAICYKRGDIRVLICDGWQMATQLSFSDVRLSQEHWQDEHTA